MAESENPPACEGEKNSLNTVKDSVFSHKELAELVKRTYKRVIEVDDKLDKVKTHGTIFRIFNAKTSCKKIKNFFEYEYSTFE